MYSYQKKWIKTTFFFSCVTFKLTRRLYVAERYLKEAAQESLAIHEEGSVHYNRFAHLVEKGVDFDVDNVVSQEDAWREVGRLLKKYQV